MTEIIFGGKLNNLMGWKNETDVCLALQAEEIEIHIHIAIRIIIFSVGCCQFGSYSS